MIVLEFSGLNYFAWRLQRQIEMGFGRHMSASKRVIDSRKSKLNLMEVSILANHPLIYEPLREQRVAEKKNDLRESLTFLPRFKSTLSLEAILITVPTASLSSDSQICLYLASLYVQYIKDETLRYFFAYNKCAAKSVLRFQDSSKKY